MSVDICSCIFLCTGSCRYLQVQINRRKSNIKGLTFVKRNKEKSSGWVSQWPNKQGTWETYGSAVLSLKAGIVLHLQHLKSTCLTTLKNPHNVSLGDLHIYI